MRCTAVLVLALLLAAPAAAQTPAQLDSMRVELVRCIAFGKGAETQATKSLDALAAGDTAAARVEMVRSRGMVRALVTQCDKSLVILDRSRGIAPPDTVIPDPPVEPEPEPEPEPPVWATGRWSLRVDGQPLALDFDAARLELPAGMGVVAVTADVTADTAHLTFSTPYGAGVMRLVHASDRVTGSMSVAGQSAAVTGERAIVTPEPDVPVPPVEPPPSDGRAFFEDNFDNGRLNSANGFKWRSSRYVDVAEIDGRRALRFRFGPVEPNGQSHMWAEQRFDLPGPMKELWVEYLIRYPSDFQHGPNSPNNDKFFRLWGGGQSAYSGNINKVGMSTRPRSIRFEYTEYGKTGTGHFNAPAAVPWEDDLGRWIQVRMHYKHASAPGAADGRMRLWKDGKLLVDFRNVNQAWNSSAPHWDSGYFLGYDNSRLSREFHIYIDDVKFYSSDPGW